MEVKKFANSHGMFAAGRAVVPTQEIKVTCGETL